jgi:hypothetical protein|tara:strand:+ start:512 stop:1195 length:684 start_codon:yes stop_codon:yes gene_type:complete
MLKYFISILVTLFCTANHTNATVSNDSLKKYGIRIGTDLQKLIKSASSQQYTGISFNADIRFKESIFLFSEIGNEKKIVEYSSVDSEISGNYIKLGLQFKLNKDMIGLRNLIYSSFGLGFSSFDQKIIRYNIYNFYSDLWGEFTNTGVINLENLNANWVEIGFGVKTEILNNLFLGIELQLKNLINQKNKNNIANFYIPGFNRTYEGSNFGTGFNYSLTYLIPIIKK